MPEAKMFTEQEVAIAELRALDDALFLAKRKRKDFYKKISKGSIGAELRSEWEEILRDIDIAQTNLSRGVDRHFNTMREALGEFNQRHPSLLHPQEGSKA